jgi:N-dimethylarginine dimethylaminohydrolase
MAVSTDQQLGPRLRARTLADVPHYEEGKPPRPLFDVDFLDELPDMWGRRWGAQTDLGTLRMVMVARPPAAQTQEGALAQGAPDFYGLVRGIPQAVRMRQQHDRFVEIMEQDGVEVVDLELPPEPNGLNTPIVKGIRGVRDVVVVNGGAIIPRNAIATKRGCEPYWLRRFAEIGCPILLTIHGNGVLEGGNVVWVNSKTVLVGMGLRTNEEGLRQAEFVFRNVGVEEVRPVYLSGYLNRAYGYQHHLDCVFNMVDVDTAVCWPPGLDYLSLDSLLRKGIRIIEVPEEEMRNAACNTLALRPGRVVLVAGNPRTAEALDKAGVEVIELEWSEYTRQGGGASGGGGPICSTAPLIRDPQAE